MVCTSLIKVRYYVLGLALFSTSSYEEVMQMLVAGL